MRDFFEGWYYKHQKGDKILALIPGRTKDAAFIQVVTGEHAYHIPYPVKDFHKNDIVYISGNTFSSKGIRLNIHTDVLHITGELTYTGLTPISSDIMGPFRFLPMECRHTIISMNHSLQGRLVCNGQEMDFDEGKGYIEGDRGYSFPEKYAWVQCNAFQSDCSIMVSIARIPFCGLRFWGCICIIWLGGREYRLATYQRAQVVCLQKGRLELKQGKYRLIAEMPDTLGHGLHAPDKGVMRRTIHEVPACRVRFRFYEGETVLLDEIGEYASFEFVE